MNKKGNPAILLLLIVLLVIFAISTGYLGISNWNKKASLDNVRIENPTVSQGEQTKLFFNIENNLDTTLNPKIEIKINQDKNERCFYEVDEKILDNVFPKDKLPSYIYITSVQKNFEDDNCKNRLFVVTLYLKDFNGKVLDSETVEIGIV